MYLGPAHLFLARDTHPEEQEWVPTDDSLAHRKMKAEEGLMYLDDCSYLSSWCHFSPLCWLPPQVLCKAEDRVLAELFLV